MKNSEKKTWDRDQIILALVKMRVEKFATTKTMLHFLMIELGYKLTYSYELIKESKKKVTELFKEENEESFFNAMARLEEMIETTKNEKVRLESLKEMNKLLGLHRPTKVEVSGQVQIQGIDIQIISGTQNSEGNEVKD